MLSSPFLSGRELNFVWILMEWAWKIKKGGGIVVQEQVLKVGSVWHFFYLFFSRFIKWFLHLLITLTFALKSCIMHAKKYYFFLPP